MNRDNEHAEDRRFEDYLRKFRPSWSPDELRRNVLQARARRRDRFLPVTVWIGAAAAILLLCLALPGLLMREETVEQLVKETVKPFPAAEPARRADEMVRYGTLLAAIGRNHDALGAILDEASPLLLTPSVENGKLRSMLMLEGL